MCEACEASHGPPYYPQLNLLPFYRRLVDEEFHLWHSIYYHGPGVVLDLGAGCGETAEFYLRHGAEKVLAIEPDPEALAMIEKNFGPIPEAVKRYFAESRVIVLPFKIDHVKVDIEGAERGMLVETHFRHRWNKVNHAPYLMRLEKRRLPFRFWHRVKVWIAHEIRRGIDRLFTCSCPVCDTPMFEAGPNYWCPECNKEYRSPYR